MKLINLKIGNRTFLLILLFVGVAVVFTACSKLDEGVAQVNTGADGIAVRGYDTVAFFAENGAIKGNPSYEFAWNGAK